MTDVYSCGQQSPAFKWLVISIDSFANLAGNRTTIKNEVMDKWHLFLPVFLELFEADPQASETLTGLLDLFCRPSS